MKKLFSFVLVAACAIGMAQAQTTEVTVDCGGSAKITATPETGYHFLKWNDGTNDYITNPLTLTDIQADATYKAFFEINTYTIKFVNYDDSELQSEELEHGAAISYKGETPTKPATDQYSYTFSGWNPNIPNPAVATEDLTLKAQFDETVNKYTITFQNYDGTVLQSSQVEYGTVPSYEGSTPTKPADAQYIYAFTGWDVTPVAVTGDATYTATFGTTDQTYTITYAGENGTFTGDADGTYQYNTTRTFTAVPNTCYKFVKWADLDDSNPDSTNPTRTITVQGNATYTAIFEKITYIIHVETDDATQGGVNVEKL